MYKPHKKRVELVIKDKAIKSNKKSTKEEGKRKLPLHSE